MELARSPKRTDQKQLRHILLCFIAAGNLKYPARVSKILEFAR
jgi:hypothetical protein